MLVPLTNVKLFTAIVIILGPALLIFMLLSRFEPDTKDSYQFSERVQKLCRPWFIWQEAYRKCVLNYLKTRHSWNHMQEAIANCLGQTTFEMMNVKFLHNRDDVKLIILPYSNNTPCSELTLGVGGDIRAEKQLLQLVPNCELFGADPMLNVGKIFNEVGKYYEVAVSAHNGIFNSSVYINDWYYMKEVPNIEFVEFISQNLSRKTFDYFFFDNEGPEYEILPMLHRGGIVEANEIVFCQISIELHAPFQNYGINETQYDSILKNLVQFSPFLPLWQDRPGHARMFLINAENEYCVEKFLQPWCHSEN